jgi:hypothetical protein
MQEYFLSRRTLYFTRSGVLWSCKNSDSLTKRWFRSEYGDDWVVVHDYKWNWLVTSYTRRKLTFKSDKLLAICGLANEFARGTNKRYCHGLWLEDMPEALFWYGEQKLRRDVENDIPSWSWASTTGEIHFKDFDEPERACGAFSIDTVKQEQLVIIGLIKKVETVRGPMQCQAFSIENLYRMDFTGGLQDEYKANNIRVAPTFLLLQGVDKVGWGVFDEFELPFGPTWCVPLLRQRVWEWYVSSEPHFYWVLLLQHCPSKGAYTRVGWGLVLRTSWFADVVTQKICLA